jgi:aminopeptidase N
MPSKVIVDYSFVYHDNFDGLSKRGFTLVWPYWCGNLFPCKSDPADGLTFGLSVTGQPAGQTSIYPENVPADAASYQIAWTTGEYTKLDLGKTTAGTQIVAYHLAGGDADAQTGTMYLRDTFDWYEKTYGNYIFGTVAGSVSANWSPIAYGGMEHHPMWHIGYVAMKDPWIHAHEAAHGWFGDGVRIACWEDFVLSEGTVSYLEARSITQVMGAAEGQKVWDHYQMRLDNAMAKAGTHIAWPNSCGVVDILKDGLFGDIPYIKGAFFYKALEAKITAAKLDSALASFYSKYKGKAAKMQDLLDEVKAVSGYDPNACATSWLRSDAVPVETTCL